MPDPTEAQGRLILRIAQGAVITSENGLHVRDEHRPPGHNHPTSDFIARMEREGWIVAGDHPRRGVHGREYMLTPKGRAWADRRLAATKKHPAAPQEEPAHG
ncbi:hypothetical protein HL658_31215 [Azospirillum sp. RWY-5-1]|uniref:MarR family transcriptional regulator n=1 Tax=Azospirillum oleiclasticum TaxID=2735135 RepID=A0ABX2TJJ5_9PROT|nr:hypothetical protein [Azospirillum oleiclasticum]NYZ17035.1 hypothetical protein [Azospirillum oleiclasticum]NYZ24521.1 hypothetical protein [Azospirillum oleiclasticum]